MTSLQQIPPVPLSATRRDANAASTARGCLAALALLWTALTFVLASCSGRTVSTDTGNPSVDDPRIHVAATDDGVLVTGDPGAVSPGGATVLVFNDTTDDSATTTAESDGSFQVELEGTVDDDIRVEASAAPPELVSVNWKIHAVVKNGGALRINDGNFGGITFKTNGAIEIGSVCNSGGGSYRVSPEGQLTLSGMVFTDAACDVFEREQDIIAMMSDGVVSFTIDSGNDGDESWPLCEAAPCLTLTRGGVSIIASGVPFPNTNLDGRTFLLESAEGYNLVEGTTIRLTFQDEQVSFHAGCNSYSGAYSLCDGALCAGGFGSTNIGCDAALHEQDEEFAALLSAMPFLELEGERLTLRNNDAETRRGPDFVLVFVDREVADPDRPLQGGIWTIDSLIDGGAASSSGSNLGTLAFGANGVLDVQAECNAGEGGYSVDQGTGSTATELSLSRMMYTEEACEMRELIQEVMTDGTVTFTIEANRLTIMRGDIGISATKE